MYKSEKLNEAILGNRRTFQAKLVVGETEIKNGILEIKQYSQSTPDELICIGGAVSSYVEVKMWKPEINLENTEIEVSIGMVVDGEEEFIPLGFFTVQKPRNDDGVIRFTAYDRIKSKMCGAYFSELEYPADGKTVLAEISTKTGVPIDTSNLPDGVMIQKRVSATEASVDEEGNEITNTTYVNPFNGYTYREALGYIAQLYGKFATVDRTGTAVFRWYEEVDYTLKPNRYYDDLVTNEQVFTMGVISCQVGESTLTSGTGTASIQIENPVMTQERLDAVYEQIKDFQFLPAEVSFLGDMHLELGDIITVYDKAGNIIRIPLMSILQDFDGGLLTKVKSYGKTEQEASSSKGPTAQKLDRMYTDLFLVKELVGNKASFEYVYAMEGRFKSLDASVITGGTLSVDRLIIRGSENSIIYKLNQLGELTAEQLAEDEVEKYMLHGKTIVAESVTADKIATDAIMSRNYLYSEGDYAASGSFFNLADGSIRSKNFAIDAEGNASFKGKLNGATGSFSGDVTASSLYVYEDLYMQLNDVTRKIISATDWTATSSTLNFGLFSEVSNVNDKCYIEFYSGSTVKTLSIISPHIYLQSTGPISLRGDMGIILNSTVTANVDLKVIGSIYEDGTALSDKYLAKTGNAVSATTAKQLQVTLGDGTSYVTLRQSGSGSTGTCALSFVVTNASGTNTFYPIVNYDNTINWVPKSGGTFTGTVAAPTLSCDVLKSKSGTISVTMNEAAFKPTTSNAYSMGTTNYLWTTVFAKTSTINTSDEMEKDILPRGITEAHEKWFMDLEPILYRWKQFDWEGHVPDRIHCGLGARRSVELAEKHGLTMKDIAALCYDKLEEPLPDGRTERYSIRFGELHGYEIHMIQKNVRAIATHETYIQENNAWKNTVDIQLTTQEERLNMVTQQLQEVLTRETQLLSENALLREEIYNLQIQLQAQA